MLNLSKKLTEKNGENLRNREFSFFLRNHNILCFGFHKICRSKTAKLKKRRFFGFDFFAVAERYLIIQNSNLVQIPEWRLKLEEPPLIWDGFSNETVEFWHQMILKTIIFYP
jgi:hypothetical protein